MASLLYKVTDAHGGPIHGGAGAWSLPTAGAPGAWRTVDGPLVRCYNGLHLTDDPVRWWMPNCRIWVAEGEDFDGSVEDDSDRKVVCRKARLVREVTDMAELAELRVYASGRRAVTAGIVVAYGSATVRASGSATVEASDSATVRASGSATVRASDSATVQASDSATVRASDSATVRASDSATVEASDSATVRASDSATVQASDSAPKIHAVRKSR